MKSLRFALAAIVLAAGTFAAFAFTNTISTEKDLQVHTYYVTGAAGSGPSATYSVQTSPRECDGTGNPCRVLSTQAILDDTGNILQSSVTAIESQQSGF